MKIIQRIWNEIRSGENIDLYVATPMAIGLAVLSIVGLNVEKWIAPVTLVILSLLATSLLANRRGIKELTEKLSQSPGSVFLDELPDKFNEDFNKATELWLIGVSLTTIIRLHYSELDKKLRKGCVIKALLVHPTGPAVEMSQMRAYFSPNVEREKQEILNSLQDLCNLKQIAPDRLEIRTINFLIEHGAVLMNPESASGILYIQNYPFKVEGGSRPKFVLRASDGHWYDFYKRESEVLWENGQEWNCEDKGE